MTRRSITALTLFTSLALVACEDGPTQTYNPVGPGQTPNTGNGTVVNPGSQGYTSSVGGATKTDICPADLKAKRWKWMVNQPILPPTSGAGINIAGGDTWGGLTIDQAEQYDGKDGTDPGTKDISPGTPQGGLCQSTNVGDQFGNGTIVNTWGDGNEVWMDYKVSTRKANWLNFWQGYIGEVKANTPDAEGKDVWEIPLAPNPIKKNGTNQEIQWLSANHKDFDQPFNQLYRALMHTFQPALPLEDPTTKATCYDSGRCIQGNFGDVAYFYIPAIGFAMWVDNQNAPQPTPSIMTRFDQDLAKVMAYSFASPVLKLDAEGPVAHAGVLQAGGSTTCDLGMGIAFGDFLKNCVQTTGDSGKDKTELNKLLGGLSHTTERFHFDVQGIDVNFTDLSLKADDIVHDTDVPVATDTSTDLDVDQSTLGPIANDYTGNDPTKAKDLHGAGAVYREYMRLVRQDLLALQGVADGDISKCNFPANWFKDPTFDPGAFQASMPAYCTGFEGFITTSQGAAGDINNLGLNALHVAPGGLKTGLKLGHEKVIFCDDATGDLTTGYKSCSGGDNFQTAFHRVLKVFGKGNLASLPTEVQDVRFFWKEYVKAAIKYFKVAGDPTHITLADVSVDPDGLFFDSVGAGQFEIAEYVERGSADKTHPPTDFQFTADVKNGIFDDYEFSRDLYRGETALYAATLKSQADGIGQENTGLLTNIFGSPVLTSGWAAASTGKTAYYCATHNDPTHCDNQTCPINPASTASDDSACLQDELGRPILYGYEGAFAGNATVFQLQTANAVPVTISSTFDSIQQAMIDVPLYTNPYDQTSAPLDHLKVLVPWAPKQPGIGFPIALNGGIDRFITTAQLDLSGTTITANIDYDVHIDGTTHKPDKDGKLDFKAVETTDYLGELFMCQDAATGDLLRVRMYTPVANILNWLESHPGTYSSCQMVIRYSPFGNYADYITSLANGVRVGITQGGGFGRVNDSTLFVPGQ